MEVSKPVELSYKKLSYLVMTVLISFSAFYYFDINDASKSRPAYGQGAAIGPEYFPNVLAMLLLLMCVLGLFRTYQMEDRKIEIAHSGQILLGICATALFMLAWSSVGLFYPFAFLFVGGLIFAYRVGPDRRARTAATSSLVALLVTAAIYLVFELLMSFRF